MTYGVLQALSPVNSFSISLVPRPGNPSLSGRETWR